MASLRHTIVYLVAICLFSISFLVFINSTVSFVVTDVIGQHQAVGDSVGTLGFVDELVALAACPLWGLLSDRIGIRTVAVSGYVVVGLAFFAFVQAENVVPQLLLARMFFSVGGAATATMVTAILPSISVPRKEGNSYDDDSNRFLAPAQPTPMASTEATLMSHTLAQRSSAHKESWLLSHLSGNRLAGLVGVFAGCGALLALGVFLPLPSQFQKHGVSPKAALKDAYYIVGLIALVVSLVCFIGLRNLRGEQQKGLHALWNPRDKSDEGAHKPWSEPQLPYGRLFAESIRVAGRHPDICLGYIGGFVARASSVGLSLFIPLFVNNYFITSGLCKFDDETQVKSQCREAYVLAAKLTGVSQLIALVMAPAFGYFSDKIRFYQVPLLVAAASGMVGYAAFAFMIGNPDPSREGGTSWVYLLVSLLGVAQIGAIVCSLGLIARTISASTYVTDISPRHQREGRSGGLNTPSPHPELVRAHSYDETQPLLGDPKVENYDLTHLKGSIAGAYSLAGGSGILLLTKLGGALFDSQSASAPFVMLFCFNVILFVATLLVGFMQAKRALVAV